jgi:hypothetical protein
MLKKPLYPLILSCYFVLFVFAENLGEVFLDQLLLPIVAISLLSIFVAIILAVLFRSAHTGALLAGGLLSIIFVHNGVHDLLSRYVGISDYPLLALEGLALGALAFVVLRGNPNWSKINHALNVTFGVLLLISAGRIAAYGLLDGEDLLTPEYAASEISSEGTVQLAAEAKPDVYYILLDAYARADVLQEFYNYDNSGFIDFLRQSGFSVADKSVANYPFTFMVVGGVFSMDYTVTETGYATLPTGHKIKGNAMILNHQVGKTFEELGYRIVTIRSIGNYLGTANALDLSLEESWIVNNEFHMALLDTTLLPQVLRGLLVDTLSRRKYVEFAIDEVARQVTEPGPKFVAVHIMSPHAPFFYDREGHEPDVSRVNFGLPDHLSEDIRGYRDQVHFLNIKIKNMIEDILERSAVPPIIVVQGDHGLRRSHYETNDGEFSTLMETGCPRELLANLNAFYLPGAEGTELFYESISPVNTFRLIFDTYFNAEMGLIEDRSFLPPNDPTLKSGGFYDATQINEHCSPEWVDRFAQPK